MVAVPPWGVGVAIEAAAPPGMWHVLSSQQGVWEAIYGFQGYAARLGLLICVRIHEDLTEELHQPVSTSCHLSGGRAKTPVAKTYTIRKASRNVGTNAELNTTALTLHRAKINRNRLIAKRPRLICNPTTMP